MKKFLVAFAVMLAAGIVSAQAVTIDSKSSLLMEMETGKILHEAGAHDKLAPASVTKVMTMLLIYEAIDQERIKWDDMVTVSAHAASMGGSQVYLEPGELQSVRCLVKSIVIASANDAAVAMAEFISGSEEAFVGQMNAKAAALGMENTSFLNSCGLDAPGHLTTAYDIALMSRELMQKYPEVQEYATTRLDKIVHKTKRGEEDFGLTNTNKLIRNYPGTTGLKTGSTGIALYCISATAEKDGMHLIAVVMAAPCPVKRFDGAMQMFDYGFANFALVQKEEAGTSMGDVRVYKGESLTTPAVIKEQTNMLAPKGKHVELTGEVTLTSHVDAPVPAGYVVGEVVYTWEGAEVGRSELIVPEDVPKAGLGTMAERIIRGWLYSPQ
jgi:D-alanyl-D-alanine carboxypeptidase (penicillin-binding protein 5/6)